MLLVCGVQKGEQGVKRKARREHSGLIWGDGNAHRMRQAQVDLGRTVIRTCSEIGWRSETGQRKRRRKA